MSGGGAGFPADCFDGTGGIADDGLTEYSLLPIEVRDAVLTTAAIEVAVIPLDGFSVIDAPSKTSSDEGTCIGAHFSCKGARVLGPSY